MESSVATVGALRHDHSLQRTTGVTGEPAQGERSLRALRTAT